MFLRAQFGAIGVATIPFAALDRLLAAQDRLAPGHPDWPPPARFAAAGACVFAAGLAGLRLLPHRMLIATLLLAGWGWAIPFRGNTEHEFEAMFHLGVPLVFWSLALLGLRHTVGRRRAALALSAAAIAAAAVFAVSAWEMGRLGDEHGAGQSKRDAIADFRAMRPFTTGHTVRVAGSVRARYLLTGYWAARSDYDYVVLPANLGSSLTPDNRFIHLYDPASLDDGWAALTAREPAASSVFDVYLDPDGRTLTYAREECSAADTEDRFFVRAYPSPQHAAAVLAPEAPKSRPLLAALHELAAAAVGSFGGRREDELPKARGRIAEFEHGGFVFGERGLLFPPLPGRRHWRCLVQIELPEYELRSVSTGQYDETGELWNVVFAAGAWRDSSALLDGARLLASAHFDVHLDEARNRLVYVREACAGGDTDAGFFLRVQRPAGSGGSANLGFAFAGHGFREGGRCLAVRNLPDYAVASFVTGQWTPERGELWYVRVPRTGEFRDEEFAGAWLARFEALAAREPDARRAGYALHVEGRTLTFVREGCSAADVADRFFVHVYASGGREACDLWFRAPGGREGLDFRFGERGLRLGGRCMASVELPEYAVARVVTGQWDASGHLWEQELRALEWR